MSLRFWKSIRRKSVSQDWRSELPLEKSQVYTFALAQAEPAYNIFSVTLDQAILLSRSGKMQLAGDQVELSAELCVRFAAALECLLNVVERHADSFGLVPSVKPLDPLFFAGETARRAAKMNLLLSTVLFKQSTCFLHKVRTLGEMAAKIAEEYRLMTATLTGGNSNKQSWDHLSMLQDDLTTSLSEATVMLKSFIISLPPGEVNAFADRLAKALLAMQAAPQRMSPKKLHGNPAVPDRRASAIRGE